MVKRRRGYKRSWRHPPPIEIGDVIGKPPLARYSVGLIEETKAVWQPYYSAILTDEDAREIIENMVSFMSILVEIREQSRKSDEASPNPGLRRR